jgi:hypothetical protein
MVWRHPWLAIMHVVDKRYVAPPKPSAVARAAKAATRPATPPAAPDQPLTQPQPAVEAPGAG